MDKTISLKPKYITLAALIFAGEAIFFLPFVLPRIFRPTLLAVFEISNTELGSYYPVYGIIAMVSYFFGGPLADKYPARNLMSLALWLTALGGLLMVTIPNGFTMKILYGFWGLTTILLFWAALIRATREWGGHLFQGRAFGWLEGGRGLTAAIMGTVALLVFSSNNSSISGENLASNSIASFQMVIITISGLTFISGIVVWFFVPKISILAKKDEIRTTHVLKIAKIPSVWILSGIIICAYVGYKITDDFSLFAHEVLNFSEVKASGVGTVGLWMRAIVAFFTGFLADRYLSSKIIIVGFSVSAIGGILVASGISDNSLILIFINLAMLMVGIYGVRALYFALIEEAKIPLIYTGTAVGLISVIGFTPDVFMSPWMGHLLDKYPGVIGHRYVFIVLAAFALVGLLMTILFRKLQAA